MKANKDNKVTPFISGTNVNREYSWIKFNQRVLDQAADESNPLLERCKFLSIFCSNFDEFYMVRVGSLFNESKLSPNSTDNKTGLTAEQQIGGILAETKKLYRKRNSTFLSLKAELKRHGINILETKELGKRQYTECQVYFSEMVLPLLFPMVLDAKHPMIRFENMNSYMVYELKKEGRSMFGVMSVSPKLKRLYRIESGKSKKLNLITIEELVRTFGPAAFPGYEVEGCTMVRVTRNADFDTNIDDADVEHDFDFSKLLKSRIETRGTLAVVRLEIDNGNEKIKEFLLKNLGIKKQYCFKVEHHFDYKFLTYLDRYLEPEQSAPLKYPPFKGRIPRAVEGVNSLVEYVRHRDIFLSYPFDSMETLIRLLNECAENERVASIKITIYRLDNHSRIVDALKKASENGKEVTVVIELCARFDEENNLYFANMLQEAGCTIIYGMNNYKVHSKIISIALTGGEEIEYITHLGTGNYNESTSRQYTDLNVITANREIGEDAVAFFRNIAICNTEYNYKQLLIAPETLKSGLMQYMDREIDKAKAGRPARIIAKMNSLTDKQMMEKLSLASKSGVKVSLIVRGICCLLPGIEGETDNIEVVSIVGRFLEHSRVYCFGEGEERKLFISSADLMTRNVSKRVEIATPILDREIEREIFDMLEIMLSDNVKARKLMPDGEYLPVRSEAPPLDAQNYFLRQHK